MSTLLKVKAPIQERIVQISDGEGFAVRGLNPFHVVGLYRRHAGALEPIYAKVIAAATSPTDTAALAPAILSALSEAPELIAELIVLASGGNPDDLTEVAVVDPTSGLALTLPSFEAAMLIARQLPFPVQTSALTKIGELTFTSDMPPGKFFALVVAALQSLTGAMEGLNSRLPAANGSGASAVQ